MAEPDISADSHTPPIRSTVSDEIRQSIDLITINMTVLGDKAEYAAHELIAHLRWIDGDV
jgi:hypothetical protein